MSFVNKVLQIVSKDVHGTAENNHLQVGSKSISVTEDDGLFDVMITDGWGPIHVFRSVFATDLSDTIFRGVFNNEQSKTVCYGRPSRHRDSHQP